MKSSLAISLIFSLCFLTGCFFTDDIFEPPVEKGESLQVKSQNAVADYLKNKTDRKYRPFGFGTITIHKPKAIVELEELQSKAKKGMTDKYDSLITAKKKYIRENNIERTVDLDHFFTLTDTTGAITVYETNFILNDTLGVKDLSAKIVLPLKKDLLPALENFFYEYNIFVTPSYYESLNLSSNFYAFFKSELEKRKGINEKSAFLLHTLKLTSEISKRGAFEQEEILQQMVNHYMKSERDDIEDYVSITYSDLYQKNDDSSDEVTGYYFFHKFIGTYEENRDTNVVLIEFNPYYEIGQIYNMDRPFDQYFNN